MSDNPPITQAPLTKEQQDRLCRIRDGLKITKVVCTRAIKGRAGDTFAGLAAAWNTVQEDGGQGLVHVGLEEADPQVQGMTLKEAVIAAHLVGLQVDLVALQNACAGGVIDENRLVADIQATKHNYMLLIGSALTNGDTPTK